MIPEAKAADMARKAGTTLNVGAVAYSSAAVSSLSNKEEAMLQFKPLDLTAEFAENAEK
jgi:hypothetical protein